MFNRQFVVSYIQTLRTRRANIQGLPATHDTGQNRRDGMISMLDSIIDDLRCELSKDDSHRDIVRPLGTLEKMMVILDVTDTERPGISHTEVIFADTQAQFNTGFDAAVQATDGYITRGFSIAPHEITAEEAAIATGWLIKVMAQ